MSTPALKTQSLCMAFGALVVADNIDFSLERGARHALIGPNGAGKTTFVNLLTGRLRPTSGQVWLDGMDITRYSPAQRVKAGLGRTFQINSLFTKLTVVDNVCLAIAERTGLAGGLWRPASAQAAVINEANELLSTLGLADDRHRVVSDLPYGKQRLVEIAVTLGLRPGVLLLDEPAAGVPSHESHIIFEVLERLPSDISILFIEHDMDLVFRFASRITVLCAGATLIEGTPEEIRSNEMVRDVYLGESHV